MRKKIVYVKKNWKDEKSLLLSGMTFLYTSLLISMLCAEFLTHEELTPEQVVTIYYALLGLYVFSKECVDRWILKIRWMPRKGELFVLTWTGITLWMCSIQVLTNGLYETPPEVFQITMTVLGFYGASRGSKKLFEKKQQKKQNTPLEYSAREIYDAGYAGPSILKPN